MASRQGLGDHGVDEARQSSIEPTNGLISLPETARQASIRSASDRIGISESVETLDVPAAAGEVVDDETS